MERLTDGKESKIRPIADVVPIWEHDGQYPDLIKVAMADGQVVTYRLDVQQPHPAFTAAMMALDRMPVFGGPEVPGYKARHEAVKKPNIWDRIQAVRQTKG